MRKFCYILLVLVVASSCSEYQEALKSEDVKVKIAMADSLYNQGKYKKANRLFEQLVPLFRGKPQAERLTYFHADCYFQTEDYYLAAYQFERFSKSFPKSDKAEIAAFNGAKSYYYLSPRYSIDQEETIKAIDKLQEYINGYPNSEKISEANELIKELNTKLEKKSFEVAKQYNTIRDYKSAIKAFENFISDYPGTPYREKALYYKFDSAYELAINSIEQKKEERLQNAKTFYEAFKRYYSESEFLAEADKQYAAIEEELQKFAN